MPAAVETMMYAGDVPWHGLGEYVGDEDILSAAAITKAGLDWEVEPRELVVKDNPEIDVPEARAIVRTTDNSVLGVVGTRYTPVQNAEAFGFMDELVKDGEMRYHTAGALKDGRQIWMLGKIHGNIEPIKGDVVDQFLLLSNTHDGKGALRVYFTPVRVVCANTLALAAAGGKGHGVSIRHTQGLKSRLKEAQEVLGLAQKRYAEFDKFANELANMRMTNDQWVEFQLALFPDPVLDDNVEETVEKRVQARVENQRAELDRLYRTGRGTDIPGVKGTGWAAFNAVTEYTNYYKPTRGENSTRFSSIINGPGHDMNMKAQQILTGML